MNDKDTIYRQAAIDAILHNQEVYSNNFGNDPIDKYTIAIIDNDAQTIAQLPSAQPEPRWIPVTERLPEDLAEVNVTWVNHDPEPYYDFVKDKPCSGSAVYYKGSWYWYSSTCVDILAEYGRNEMDKIDDGIEVVAWMPLPEPWKGEEDECMDV